MAKGARGGKRGNPTAVNKAQEIKSFESKYGITISKDLKNMTTDNLYNATQRVAEIIDEYPGYFDEVKDMKEYNQANTYAAMSVNGRTLYLNPKFYDNPTTMERTYKYDVSTKWHPDGTTYNDIIVHELGHAVSFKIARNNLQGYESANASLVNKAAEEIRANSKSYGYARKPSEKKLRTEISRYATKNYSETVAEAFADYHANKENAKPLSKAIMKEIDKAMNKK